MSKAAAVSKLAGLARQIHRAKLTEMKTGPEDGNRFKAGLRELQRQTQVIAYMHAARIVKEAEES